MLARLFIGILGVETSMEIQHCSYRARAKCILIVFIFSLFSICVSILEFKPLIPRLVLSLSFNIIHHCYHSKKKSIPTLILQSLFCNPLNLLFSFIVGLCRPIRHIFHSTSACLRALNVCRFHKQYILSKDKKHQLSNEYIERDSKNMRLL